MAMSTTTAPTYEKMVEHHGLSSHQLQEPCPDDVLHALAKKMNRWQNIAVDLELDKIAVDAIEKEQIDEEGKRRNLLERWKEKFGHTATYIRALDTLSRKIGEGGPRRHCVPRIQTHTKCCR